MSRAYGVVSRRAVERIVRTEYASLEEAGVREFMPVLVERRTREHLKAQSPPEDVPDSAVRALAG